MDTGLKNRLVGAAVLFSLGIIFIPMLLDGQPEPVTQPQAIPSEPNSVVQNLQAPSEIDLSTEPLAQSTIKPVIESDIKSQESNENFKQDEIFKQARHIKPLENVNSANEEKITATATKADENATHKETLVGFDKRVWVVQVGSFSSAGNAHGLIKKLQKLGYQAFEEQIFTEKGAVYRVRVGPEADYKQAKKIRNDIKSRVNLPGLVVRYP